MKPKPVTKIPEPPEPPTEHPWTVRPVTECKDVVVEETVVVAVSSCRGDRRRLCRYWASRGECRRNPTYMNKFCCRSCGGNISVSSPEVHSMRLGPKISGVELAFLSAWRRRHSLNYTLWCTGVVKCKSQRTVLLIFVPQVYANLQSLRTSEEELLA